MHEELCGILETVKVYYQPPASVKMSYPCIRYSLSGISTDRANDKNYKKTNRYELVVMDRDPDSVIHEKILEHFSMCSFDRAYAADNINHWVLTLYY